MKKLFCLLVAAALTLGCVYADNRNKGGGGSNNTSTGTNKNTGSSTPTPTPSRPTLKWDASTHTLTYGDYSYKMVYVPGGSFTMGATGQLANEADLDEKKTHRVTLSGYYIGECEVPQWLWTAVMGSNPSSFRGATLPVETVTWYDCQDFIQKLNSKTGASFRLPTEAQGEFAAREGKDNNNQLYSGSDELWEVGWFTDTSKGTTHPVKKKKPNALGLYDMTGNVWEWCQDWYGDYPTTSQTDPKGSSSGSKRVRRGGGWDSYARICRVSFRDSFAPTCNYYNLGLRLAL